VILTGQPTTARPTPSGTDLGALLRHWRGVRRMSQLALAVEAETTSRYVSFVETGRANPSRDMVLRLATALEVPFRERNALLVAAGFAPRYAEIPLGDAALRHVDSALRAMLAHHEPFPAVILDRGWNVLRANDGAQRLFGGLYHPEPLPAPANVLRLMIGPGPVRDAVLNWEAVVVTLLARVRREAVGGVLDPATAGLVAELSALPEVRAIRHGDPAIEPVLDVRFRFGAHDLTFFSLLTTVGTPIDLTSQELRVEEFFPVDDATRNAWTAADRHASHGPPRKADTGSVGTAGSVA
jgi:transcriptional regulator with XRE-family HTH domain